MALNHFHAGFKSIHAFWRSKNPYKIHSFWSHSFWRNLSLSQISPAVEGSILFVPLPFLFSTEQSLHLKGPRKNNFTFAHPIFGSSLTDLQSQNPQAGYGQPSGFAHSDRPNLTQIWAWNLWIYFYAGPYVLVAILKKKLKLEGSLYTILQILSLTIFEKMPIQQVFADDDEIMSKNEVCNQLNLFNC